MKLYDQQWHEDIVDKECRNRIWICVVSQDDKHENVCKLVRESDSLEQRRREVDEQCQNIRINRVEDHWATILAAS
jgi:hypothetical protein